MPIKECSVNGVPGWKYGDSGKCYTGSDAKQKAFKQAYAINKSEEASGKTPERSDLLIEQLKNLPDRMGPVKDKK